MQRAVPRSSAPRRDMRVPSSARAEPRRAAGVKALAAAAASLRPDPGSAPREGRHDSEGAR